MVSVLPDSKGGIRKILFHQTAVYQGDTLVRKGLFSNLLKSFNKIGVNPEIYVFATYRDYSERIFLRNQMNDWKSIVKDLNYVQIQVSNEIWSRLPYAQDVCLVTNSDDPAAIMTKSNRYRNAVNLLRKTGLLRNAGLRTFRPKKSFNLEGGYVYACSKVLLYSNPEDAEIVRSFDQQPIFVDNIVIELFNGMLDILSPGASAYTLSEPNHVDLVFSIFEREDSYHVFYVDFKDATLSSPTWSGYPREALLRRRFLEWDKKMQRMFDRMRRHLKNINFHEMPGVIGYDSMKHFFVYSGTNLLFHSEKGKDYAFYLKFPSGTDEHLNSITNDKIESTLRNVNITPISITGFSESTNMAEIRNSSGLRCVVKVLTREQPAT